MFESGLMFLIWSLEVFNVCVCLACMYVCVSRALLVLMEVRQIP